MLENWYPTREEGDKKGVLLVVSSGKEGAVTGGPSFMQVGYWVTVQWPGGAKGVMAAASQNHDLPDRLLLATHAAGGAPCV